MSHNFEIPVSIYRNATSTEPKVVTVKSVLSAIRSGQYAAQIKAARNVLREKGESEYNKLKKTLPGVTFSGTFTKRANDKLVEHSGLICVDIDNIPDMTEARKRLVKDPYTMFLFSSPSGTGLKVGVRIPSDKHKTAFVALGEYYKTEYGLVIDPSCKDVSRLCFVSYDADLYMNANALMFDAEDAPEEFRKAVTARQQKRGGVIEAFNDAHDIETMLLAYGYTKRGRMLCRPGAPDRHSVWIHNGKSFHHSSNDPLFSEHLRDCFDVYTHFEHSGDAKAAIKAAGELLGIEPTRNTKREFEAGIGALEYFWYPKQESKNSFVVGILQSKISEYLFKNGFTKIYHGTEYMFVRIVGNVCSEVSIGQMKDFFMDYARSFPDELPPVDGHVFTKQALIEKLERGAATHFGTPQMECLPTSHPKFVRDEPDKAYVFYSNGFVTATKEGHEFHPYRELDGVIWESRKLKREYVPCDTKTGEFERFLFNVSGQKVERFTALRTAIGYMLHNYKNRSLTKAVVLLDEAISDAPEGRSGKSIVSTALCQLRSGVLLDGKKLDFDSPFVFQAVKMDTEIVIMDDVKKSFNYEAIFHMITSDFVIERKREHAISIDFKESPKIIISTNYIISGEGGSANARKAEYEFSAHYHAGYSPRDEFGHNLFDDWTADEWARFDDFMLNSITLFFIYGLQESESINIKERKLLQNTTPDFIDFMDGKKENIINTWIPKNQILDELCAKSEDCKRDKERGRLSAHKFTFWLKSFAQARGYVMTEKIMKWEGESTRAFMYIDAPQ